MDPQQNQTDVKTTGPESSSRKPTIPEKPKDLKSRGSEGGDSEIQRVDSPNSALKPRSTKEPPPIPSRPTAFVKKPTGGNSKSGSMGNLDKGSFALKSSEDFGDSRQNNPISSLQANPNSNNPSNSTSFAPSQQFTPVRMNV